MKINEVVQEGVWDALIGGVEGAKALGQGKGLAGAKSAYQGVQDTADIASQVKQDQSIVKKVANDQVALWNQMIAADPQQNTIRGLTAFTKSKAATELAKADPTLKTVTPMMPKTIGPKGEIQNPAEVSQYLKDVVGKELALARGGALPDVEPEPAATDPAADATATPTSTAVAPANATPSTAVGFPRGTAATTAQPNLKTYQAPQQAALSAPQAQQAQQIGMNDPNVLDVDFKEVPDQKQIAAAPQTTQATKTPNYGQQMKGGTGYGAAGAGQANTQAPVGKVTYGQKGKPVTKKPTEPVTESLRRWKALIK